MSVEEPSTSKRKRLDSSEDAIDPVRSDIWYDDGNVVLQAENTQFKVYRGILAQSSPVFRDMFAFPQPPLEDAQLVDGCPVVHLSDSAKEVRYILRALSGQRLNAFAHKLPFAEFAAFLCLGQKYDIEVLYLEAKRILFDMAPAELSAYYPQPQYVDRDDIEIPKAICMELVLLARRTGLLSILPYALYECSASSHKTRLCVWQACMKPAIANIRQLYLGSKTLRLSHPIALPAKNAE
ncbi:hypothetical protein HWV62_44155 [Athelia sp. TMB]|nr:hypothetical protein HWV62_44155 [Athelia sp. TMB]